MSVSTAFILREDKLREDGTCPVFLRVIENRKVTQVGTGVYVYPQLWKRKAGTSGGRASTQWPPIKRDRRFPDVPIDAMNERLERLRHDAEAIRLKALAEGRPNVTSEIIGFIKGKTSANEDFYALALTVEERLRAEGKFSGYKRIRVLVSKLKAFTGRDTLRFSELNVTFLTGFKRHLREECKNGPSTIAKDFQVFRSVVKEAVRLRLMEPSDNPFPYVKTPTQPAAKTKLTYEQVEKIAMLDLPHGTPLCLSRDVFLFAFYLAGMRFSDVCRIRWSGVKSGRISYVMAKTSRPASLPLRPEAAAILERYRSDAARDSDYVFPLLRAGIDDRDEFIVRRRIGSMNAVVNKYLKQVAEMASIEENVSTHVSRHSFADYARRMRISLFDIMQLLGHSSLRITQQYLASFDQESKDAAFEQIFEGRGHPEHQDPRP